MSFYGNYIYEQRNLFLEEFVPVFQKIYTQISCDNEKVSLTYCSQHDNRDIKASLQSTRERDRILGYSTQGIHKDELEMLLDAYPIKRVGSQGQNKTFLIAIKLAQFEFLKRTHKFPPILLLDDIFDKLDSKRVKQIIQLVSSELFGQIFITDTNREHLDILLSQLDQKATIFMVRDGMINLI